MKKELSNSKKFADIAQLADTLKKPIGKSRMPQKNLWLKLKNETYKILADDRHKNISYETLVTGILFSHAFFAFANSDEGSYIALLLSMVSFWSLEPLMPEGLYCLQSWAFAHQDKQTS